MAVAVIVGAGSMVFTRTLVSDLVADEATRELDLRLVDIDAERLATSRAMTERILAEGGSRRPVGAYLDRREALRGANYVIITIQVGGRAAIDNDFDLPARYGIRQTVADTLGIGGISRALRTIPAILEIVRDVEEVAPDALLLNYTNPMAMIVMAIAASSPIRHFGLCHSIPNTARELAAYLGVPPDELQWEAAGINHMSWMLRLEHGGRDLYPRLFECAVDPALFARDGVRFELMRWFGYFPTESSKHNAEYTSFFLPHEGEVERLHIPIDDHVGKLDRLQRRYDELHGQVEREEPLKLPASNEYAPRLIAALERNGDFVFYPNLLNQGLITNLPSEAAVEVPCFVHQGGVHPATVGNLPEGPAALNRQAITVQRLTVQGILTHDRDCIHQAALLDPQVGGRLRPREAIGLVDELIASQFRWVTGPASRRPHLDRAR